MASGFSIWCTCCVGHRPAVKVQRHNDKLAGWWNRCAVCSTMYPALPPRAATVRRRTRLYVRRSGQADLFAPRPPKR